MDMEILEQNQQENKIDLFELGKIAWLNKGLILVLSFVGFLFGCLFLYNSIYTYEVKLNIIPIKNSKMPSSNSGLIQILAAGSGLEGDNAEFELYKDLMKSRIISADIYKDSALFKKLYIESWDENKQEWIVPEESTLGKIKKRIKSLVGIPSTEKKPPGPEDLFSFLNSNLEIDQPFGSVITTMSINIKDPKLGKILIERLHKRSNEILKERTYKRALENVNFAKKALKENTKKDQRESLINYLSEQQKVLIEASSSLPYAAEKFGETIVPLSPNKPNPNLILTLGFLIGFFLGTSISWIRFYFFDKKSII